MFKLNADGVQIKCRTRPPQFDEIHQGEFQDIVAVMDDEVMVRLMNIAMIRNVSMLEFLPPPHLKFWSMPVRCAWRLRGCRSPRPSSFCSQFSSSLWSLFFSRILHT